MIKSLLLVAAMDVVYILVVTLIFRFSEVKERAALMGRLFLTTAPIYIIAYRWTPQDLWIASGLWGVRPQTDMVFGLAVYAATVFGGFLQLYNLADRGFSLRVLIDLLESKSGELTPGQAAREYSAGRGLDWFYQKRIDGLTEQRMIEVEGGQAHLTPRGRRFASIFAGLQRFLNLGEPRP